MALKRSSLLLSILLLLLLFSSTSTKGPARGGTVMMAMAEDDFHCHYLDTACTSKKECSRQCAEQDYGNGGVCVPYPLGRKKRCCCIINDLKLTTSTGS